MSGAYLPVTEKVRDRANAYLAGMAARGFVPMPIPDLLAHIKATPEQDDDDAA